MAILGAGSVRCSVPVLATLANYFGERPMQVRLYDADEERLDLFDRFARCCFQITDNKASIVASTDYDEVIDGSEKIILQVGENCARKLIRQKMGSFPSVALKTSQVVSLALEYLIEEGLDSRADVLSLQKSDVHIPLITYYRLSWPEDLSYFERKAIPHQVLRWIRGDEPLWQELDRNERTPLKEWLDDVHSAIAVSEI